MAISSNLGFPRIGRRRELKQLLEAYWSGASDARALESGARALRLAHWRFQAERGIDHIPSNDFSLYDHVLDTALMVGAVPARFRRAADRSALEAYFAMARGADQPALEMTKWFDTNYHYLVPEFEADTDFRLGPAKPVDEFRRGQGGRHPHPPRAPRPGLVPPSRQGARPVGPAPVAAPQAAPGLRAAPRPRYADDPAGGSLATSVRSSAPTAMGSPCSPSTARCNTTRCPPACWRRCTSKWTPSQETKRCGWSSSRAAERPSAPATTSGRSAAKSRATSRGSSGRAAT